MYVEIRVWKTWDKDSKRKKLSSNRDGTKIQNIVSPTDMPK